MPFSKKKFLGLEAAHRSRKLADLLKQALLDADKSVGALDEYDRLQGLAGDGPALVRRDPRSIYDAYLEQRRRGGLGPERSVLAVLVDTGDRAEPRGPEIPYEVLLHNLRSGYNIGSILRTADAFGFQRVHLSGYSPGPENDAVRAAALGAETWLPVLRFDNAAGALEEYRSLHPNAKIIALESTSQALDIEDFPWPAEALLIAGNEELGISADLLEAADHVVAVPMYGRKASLNVANAFAVAAYSARRSLNRRAQNSPPPPELEPIGVFHCNFRYRQDAPRQGSLNSVGEPGVLRLAQGRNFEQALRDLDGFDRVWLIYDFHANAGAGWRPTTRPPRQDVERVGLFASRSPYRPNRLGLSCVELVSIQGREVTVRDFDLLDGTPVYDIKPYIPYADAFPDAAAGWTEAVSEERFTVEFTAGAAERTLWIREHGDLDLESFARTQLAAYPTDDSRKRVTHSGDDCYVIAYRTWRLEFRLEERTITVCDVYSGYADEDLNAPHDRYGDRAVHLEFRLRFSERS